MRFWLIAFALAAIVATLGEARAAFVSFNPMTRRAPTAAEIAGGVPADSSIYGFYLNSDADILAIDFVRATTSGTFYQNSLNSDSEPPLPAVVAVYPEVAADSWISTPGPTSQPGPPFPGDGTTASEWGDTTNNGPQTNFQFANLTITPADSSWQFSGAITVAGTNGPESFSFEIPEPAGVALCGFAWAGGVLFTRRQRQRHRLATKTAREA
jgi:hypothetical protein